jgi:hypothetical protein
VTGNASTNVETVRVRGKLLTLITSTPTWPAVMLVVETPPPTPSKIYLRPSDIPVRANTKTVVATHYPDRNFYQPLNHVLAQSFTSKLDKPSNPYLLDFETFKAKHLTVYTSSAFARNAEEDSLYIKQVITKCKLRNIDIILLVYISVVQS